MDAPYINPYCILTWILGTLTQILGAPFTIPYCTLTQILGAPFTNPYCILTWILGSPFTIPIVP